MSAPAAQTTLAQYYQHELDMLRAEGATFAGLHPQIAEALGVGGGRSPDPHVELLQQSFAFFSGRLRHHIEIDKARIPNALAESLHPHLGAPVPSMLVARVAGIARPMTLKRGQGFAASATGSPGQHVDCRLRGCYATALLPLQVARVELAHGDTAGHKAGAVLKVGIVRDPAGPAARLGDNESLRLYIDTDKVPSAWTLYELLTLHLAGIVLALPGADGAATTIELPPVRLRWLGYCPESEGALPSHHHAPPAYRLLQEYFAFPHKFRFFEIDGLDLRAVQTGAGLIVAELQFLFDVPAAPAAFPADALRLNCVPLVNLFSQPIEPIAVDHTQVEYRLVADLERHPQHEIYTLEKLHAIRADGSLRIIAPYFAADEMNGAARPDYFYLPRRESSEATAVPGSEYFVSFLDEKLDLAALADDVVGGVALCTNRRLAEGLRVGSALHFEGAGLPVQVETISHPTPHHLPVQIGQRPWQLASQLTLNRLSLADGPHALGALQQVLALHTGPHRTNGLRQIAGITHLHCRHLMRYRQHSHGRGFLRTTAVHLRLDRNAFPGASPVLFWRVLRHFFALYVAVNQLAECSFETQDGEGSDAAWAPLEGSQWIV